MPEFLCERCNRTFQLSQEILARYPGWTPRQCMTCKKSGGPSKSKAKKPNRSVPSITANENLSPREVLARFHGGPTTGLFTDGSAQPNPGPGGWGCVLVIDDSIVCEKKGHESHTTNNRMELTALIEAYKMAPKDQDLEVFTDSQLCVSTFTQWAAGWERNGWRRKSGPIKNLELVKELWALVQDKPRVRLTWIKAHDGSRWNEYADALSTAWTRGGD